MRQEEALAAIESALRAAMVAQNAVPSDSGLSRSLWTA
jgi:hypothetical protein